MRKIKKTKSLWLTIAIVMTVSLSACSQNNALDQGNEPANNEMNAPAPSNDGSNSPDDGSNKSEENSNEPTNDQNGDANENNNAVTDPAKEQERPESKVFNLSLEGDKEPKEAKLFHGEGYSLYVFDIFNFDTQSGRLSMNYDENYNVDITKLPSDYNLDQIHEEAEAELSEIGEVEEMKGEELSDHMLNASLYLFSRSDALTNKIIVKEVDGQGYLIKVNLPHGEALEGFSPHAYTSLNSIANK